MNITITGSLGNISRRLTARLTAKGHRVTVISHNPQRAAAIGALHAIPAIGSVEDRDFLLRAFEQADAVYTMIPPAFTATDIRRYISTVGEGYAWAIGQAGVRHVVNLSSIGAHTPEGAGPAGANHAVEQQLNALPDTHVLHLRPGMFYTNFFGSIPLIRQQHIIGNNFDAAASIALTHPQDIAAVAAEALDTLSFTGKSARYTVSDEKTGAEIATLLGNAIGLPALQWVRFPDDALLQGLLESGMTPEMASVYIIEVGNALQNGTLLADYRLHSGNTNGQTPFADFAQEFAAVYHQPILAEGL